MGGRPSCVNVIMAQAAALVDTTCTVGFAYCTPGMHTGMHVSHPGMHSGMHSRLHIQHIGLYSRDVNTTCTYYDAHAAHSAVYHAVHFLSGCPPKFTLTHAACHLVWLPIHSPCMLVLIA